MKIVRNETAAVAFVTFNRPPDVRRALQRTGEFIGGYKLTISKVASEEGVTDVKEEDEEENAVNRDTEEAKIREELLETGRLFVRNLPFTTKEEDLHFLFKKFGEIAEIQVIIDKKTGKCKGFAIVEFVFPESAVAAYASADGTVFKVRFASWFLLKWNDVHFKGRMMHIIPGSEKREKKEPEISGSSEKTSYKKEKMSKLKANAAKSHSWNALFLGPNAIADTLAEKLGVEKGDLLNSESGESAGVRLALAETRLVRETREFFLANGVCLDAFSRPAAKRKYISVSSFQENVRDRKDLLCSNTVIIAKNLPAGVQAEELQRMFGKFGEVGKVLMPPEGGISAIVVMSNVVDAKKAFQALAYSRFRTQPLYLEWAPGDVFGENSADNKVAEIEQAATENNEVKLEKKKKNKREMTYEEKKAEKRKRRGLDTEVQEENVKEVPSTSKEDNGDETVKAEEGAITPVQEPTKDDEKSTEEEIIEPGSTVFVKNLSFDTTDESLDKFFRKKYRIKGVQISKKLNPADPAKSLSMGFGFVQFYTQEEALRAIKEMQGELLNGHSLELKMSHREMNDSDKLKRKAVSATEQGTCTKLLVRNIPFQASVKEIESLFASFGEIKSIRIPKKLGSRDQHRGFGFVDFISIGEAKRAFEALVHSTHVYGRRLVLEWAKNDDSVEEMREKTAEKFRYHRNSTSFSQNL
ncbi:hypothetical protein OSTOST_17675 [Ostertagia ostertagi]